MKRLLPLIIMALVAGCASEAPTATPSPSAAAAPEYLLHAPPDYSPTKRYALVLAFHGSGQTPEDMAKLTKLDQLADSKGFLVVYPLRFREPAKVERLIDEISAKWSVDPKRVHATGFSMGGEFAYQLAEQIPHRLASIAPVSSFGGTDTVKPKPLPLLTFQGGKDRVQQAFIAANSNWIRSAGCGKATTITITMEGGPTHRHESVCTGGAKFVIYDVTQMGHQWPADANALIWEFFEANPQAS